MDYREQILIQQEVDHKRKARIISTIVNALIFVLLLLPLLTFPVPPPGQPGLLVSLGLPDMGQGDDKPDMQNKEPVEEVKPKPVAEKKPEATKPKPTKSEPAKEKKILTTDDPDAVAIKKKKAEEDAKRRAENEKKRKEAEAEAKRQAEEEAKQKAEEEAKRKAAEEEARKQQEYEDAKKQYGDLFGKGKGKTNTSGNQGDPNGDPNASNLEGISTGSGTIGGGLGNRGVVSEPVIKDNSQKKGKVVVKVCVDGRGTVVSAEYTQKGSTTTDAHLKSIAIRNAKKFKFTKSTIDKQCGTITIDFRVR